MKPEGQPSKSDDELLAFQIVLLGILGGIAFGLFMFVLTVLAAVGETVGSHPESCYVSWPCEEGTEVGTFRTSRHARWFLGWPRSVLVTLDYHAYGYRSSDARVKRMVEALSPGDKIRIRWVNYLSESWNGPRAYRVIDDIQIEEESTAPKKSWVGLKTRSPE